MAKVILFFCLSLSIYANISYENALFAKVSHVKSDDVLNVRKEASYKADKIAEIPAEWYVGVERCKKVNRSVWCRVYPLVQQWSEHFGEDDIGWVNARYLKFEDRGFVTIEGRKNNCYYALECKDNTCLVIVYIRDDGYQNSHITFETKWIERSKLKGESGFGAASDDMEGYCTEGVWLEQYRKSHQKGKITGNTR